MAEPNLYAQTREATPMEMLEYHNGELRRQRDQWRALAERRHVKLTEARAALARAEQATADLPPWLRQILLAITQEVENTACNGDNEGQGGCDWCTWDKLLHDVPHSIRAKIAMDQFFGVALAADVPAAPDDAPAEKRKPIRRVFHDPVEAVDCNGHEGHLGLRHADVGGGYLVRCDTCAYTSRGYPTVEEVRDIWERHAATGQVTIGDLPAAVVDPAGDNHTGEDRRDG